jgi:serine/threonine protein kinase
LDYIHQLGAIHRDIKPANAVLTRQGAVKIVDLGLALVVCARKKTSYARLRRGVARMK